MNNMRTPAEKKFLIEYYSASTTGNYTGVYDMSSGAWEYMMSVILNSNNIAPLITNDSGFNAGESFPNEKYYDIYLYNTSNTLYTNRILGDATGEIGPFTSVKYNTKTRLESSWYKDDAFALYRGFPWTLRGGRIL